MAHERSAFVGQSGRTTEVWDAEYQFTVSVPCMKLWMLQWNL